MSIEQRDPDDTFSWFMWKNNKLRALRMSNVIQELYKCANYTLVGQHIHGELEKVRYGNSSASSLLVCAACCGLFFLFHWKYKSERFSSWFHIWRGLKCLPGIYVTAITLIFYMLSTPILYVFILILCLRFSQFLLEVWRGCISTWKRA